MAVLPQQTTSLPPGPRLPTLVQTLMFVRDRRNTMARLRRRFGDTFVMRIAPGGRVFVMVSTPEHFKEVFTGPAEVFHAGEGNAILRPVMGEHSVLLVDEDQHQRARKLLMPPFNGAALRAYAPMVSELAAEQVSGWPTGRPIRSLERMQQLTLEVILRVVFGMTGGQRLTELRPLVGKLVDIGPMVLMGWFYPRLQQHGPWRRYAAVQRQVDELLYAEIAERRQAPDGDDVLSRLLRGGGLSDAELRDQLVTLLLAGHETTATALGWTMHELARRPATLRKAQQAADTGDEEYLTAVVKEAMRLRPVIAQVARLLTEPAEIAGYRLPAGVTVAPSISLAHADRTNYDSPGEFRPERFIGEAPPANTWIPFGGGIRRCIGAGFSLMEGTAILREILTRYDIRSSAKEEPPRPRNITHVPGKGAKVVLTERADHDT
jgi:cytochrome P450